MAFQHLQVLLIGLLIVALSSQDNLFGQFEKKPSIPVRYVRSSESANLELEQFKQSFDKVEEFEDMLVFGKNDPRPLVAVKPDSILPYQESLVPVQALTKGPGYYWFGYYDKFQFDPTDRYVLGMHVDFQHRSPTKDDVVQIGMVDLEDGNRWINLGETRAWNWQQGCMLQWRPGSDSEIVWNDREGDHFVCRILDVKTRKMKTLPRPIYHLSPDGRQALGTDFSRLQDQRPGYGYPGVSDPNGDRLSPKDSTVYLLDLDTGQQRDIVSLADVARLRYEDGIAKGKLHFNHIQWSPDGKRFIFFTRVNGNRETRSYTSNLEGTDIRFLGSDSSHFEWRDADHVLIWSNGAYRLHKDNGSGNSEIVLKAANGHNSYLPGKEWLVTDTYPTGKKREQIVYLYHLPTNKTIEIGRFHLPVEYSGEWRCDTHPRLSRDGTKVVIDSAHSGNGRQLYMMDISHIMKTQDASDSKSSINYDESKVPDFTLPDPLTNSDNSRVVTPNQWNLIRRKEILDLFEKHVYGAMPPAKPIVDIVDHGIIKTVLGGKVRLHQVTLSFDKDRLGPNLNVCIFLPPGADRPIAYPAFLACNFSGNHSVDPDPNIRMNDGWIFQQVKRGATTTRWPIEQIVERGYAVVTLCYGDIDPDTHDDFKNGVHQFFPEFQDRDDNWASIGGWAWGLSRVLDYLEDYDEVDASNVAIMGHSRLGKTALWAGATDERFALVISNNSGCGGAALARRQFGETVARINTVLPHWFCATHKQYNNNENELPVDQHMLLSLIAPRPLYVASAAEDHWADPRGEFLSCVGADPVYKLLGTSGLPDHDWPEVDHPIVGQIGYHVRSGKHDVTAYDWEQYLNFADKHLKND